MTLTNLNTRKDARKDTTSAATSIQLLFLFVASWCSVTSLLLVDAGKLRVLCLHGFLGSGRALSVQLGTLVTENIDIAEFTFTDAPFIIPSFFGKSNKSRKYSWWSDIRQNVKNNKQGVEYIGLYDSVAKIAHEQKVNGPFDVVIGHSQGAAVVVALAALCSNPKLFNQLSSSSSSSSSPEMNNSLDIRDIPNPSVSVILSGFLPQDYIFSEYFTSNSPPILTTPPTTLHVYAHNDKVLPPIASIEAINMFKSPLVHITSNGHDPPRDEETIMIIRRILESLYKDKANILGVL